MDQVHQIVNAFLTLLVNLFDLVMHGLALLEGWLAAQLTAAGVSGQLQPIIMIVVAVLFLLAALRLMGGVVRLLIVLFLALLIVHILAPTLHF